MNNKAPLAVGTALLASLMASEARGEIKNNPCPINCTTAQTETLNRIHDVLGIDLLSGKNENILQITPDDPRDRSAIQIHEDGSVQPCKFISQVRLACRGILIPPDEFIKSLEGEVHTGKEEA